MQETHTAATTSSIAHLAEADDDDEWAYLVHGVAQGEDELTRGLHSPKFWPAEEVRDAAASLTGSPVVSSHEGDRREVGQVLRSAYQPGVGVVYEAGLSDAEIAEELSLGQREVSIEAGNPERVDEDEETGAAILRGYEYTALATPESGASPGNYSAAGPADDNPAVAALSADHIKSALGVDVAGGDTDDPTGARSPGADDNSDPTMADNNGSDGPSVEALLERVDDREAQIESLETEVEETKAKLSEKDERMDELKDEVEEAKRAYAARLAEHDPVNDEDDYVDRYEVAELRAKFDELDESLVGSDEPDVQSGGGGSGDGTGSAALANLDDDARADLEDAKENYLYWQGSNETVAQAEADRIASLAGVESVDDIDLSEV